MRYVSEKKVRRGSSGLPTSLALGFSNTLSGFNALVECPAARWASEVV